LLRALHGRGLQVVLATSAKPDLLSRLLAEIGAADAIDFVVSSEDVSTSKPAPEIFVTALERANLPVGRTLVVGDSVWDVKAAARSHLPAVAVLCGGTSKAELQESGATQIYEDPADLLANLDRWLRLIPTGD